MPLSTPPIPMSVELTRTVSVPAPASTLVGPATVRTMIVSSPSFVVSAVLPVWVEWIVKVSPPEPRSIVSSSNVV